MTAKRFKLMSNDEVIIDNCSIADDGGKQTYWVISYGQRVKLVELLNELHEEKEYWKGNACNNSNFVNILLHELDIAQEKGYEVSDPFKKLMEKELKE